MQKVLIFFFLSISLSLFAQDQDSVYVNPDEPPQFPGGDFEMFSYLEEYVLLNTPTQELWYMQVRTYYALVKFIVDKSGEVREVKLDYRTDNEERRAETIDGTIPRNYLLDEILSAFEQMPKWEPGKVDGEPVHTQVYVRVELFYDGNQIIATPRHIFPESVMLAQQKITKKHTLIAVIAAGFLVGVFYFFLFRR